jgi:hypothetical protein
MTGVCSAERVFFAPVCIAALRQNGDYYEKSNFRPVVCCPVVRYPVFSFRLQTQDSRRWDLSIWGTPLA